MSSAAVLAPRADEVDEWGRESEAAEEEDSWTPLLLVGTERDGDERRRSARVPPPADEKDDVRTQFDLLADELVRDGAGVSIPRRLAGHPAYVGILSLGEQAIPLLVERLESQGGRPLWLTLLGSLTGFQPGAGKETVREAAAEWLSWSKRTASRS